MKKLFVTFGQVHVHKLGNVVYDKDCVAVIQADTYEEADTLAFALWNGKFHQHCPEDRWDESKMKYFPRGYIPVNFSEKDL
jgi:hypothetical protein